MEHNEHEKQLSVLLHKDEIPYSFITPQRHIVSFYFLPCNINFFLMWTAYTSPHYTQSPELFFRKFKEDFIFSHPNYSEVFSFFLLLACLSCFNHLACTMKNNKWCLRLSSVKLVSNAGKLVTSCFPFLLWIGRGEISAQVKELHT